MTLLFQAFLSISAIRKQELVFENYIDASLRFQNKTIQIDLAVNNGLDSKRILCQIMKNKRSRALFRKIEKILPFNFRKI